VCTATNSTNVVIVQFRAIGNAPILKQKLFKITASQKFQAVNLFLRKELNYAPSEALVSARRGLIPITIDWFHLTHRIIFQFLYINSAFAPAPDEVISNLYKVRLRC
jgi:ubiquitin-like protein ATG12